MLIVFYYCVVTYFAVDDVKRNYSDKSLDATNQTLTSKEQIRDGCICNGCLFTPSQYAEVTTLSSTRHCLLLIAHCCC